FTAAESGHRPRTWAQDVDGGLPQPVTPEGMAGALPAAYRNVLAGLGRPQPVTPEGMAGTLLAADGKLIAGVDRYQQYSLYPVDGGEPSALAGFEDGDL